MCHTNKVATELLDGLNTPNITGWVNENLLQLHIRGYTWAQATRARGLNLCAGFTYARYTRGAELLKHTICRDSFCNYYILGTSIWFITSRIVAEL